MLLFEIDRNIEAVVCTLPVAILVHKAAGNVVGLDPLETVYLREGPLEVAGRDTPDLLLTVEHADGGLALVLVFSEGEVERERLVLFDFPEYRLTVPASGILERHADDPEYLPVYGGAVRLLPPPGLLPLGLFPGFLLGPEPVGLRRLFLELVLFP